MKLLLVVLVLPLTIFSQVVNTGMTDSYDSLEIGKVKIGGLIDTYYGYDFNRPPTADRPYGVSSSRHNEININLAYIELQYLNERVRGRLIPGFGTYVNANYAGEKGSLKNLIEANVGVRLSKKKEVWVDAGVFGSPYTNETAISKDHFMYTRSLASEYVPYYLTGVKLSSPLGRRLKGYAYLLNGWQVITDVNNSLAFGTQLEYRPNNKVLINWDTYIGDERSAQNPTYRLRYFTDAYVIYSSGRKFSLTSCAYIGLQDTKDSLGVKSSSTWWQGNVIAQWEFSKKYALSARAEYFSDKQAVVAVPVTTLTGFDAGSVGLCFNLRIGSSAAFRIEGRSFFSSGNVFINREGEESSTGQLLISNLTVWF